LTAAFVAGTAAARAQQSYYQRFTSHNTSMSALQPSWIVPLVAPDPRLIQYARASFSHQYTAARTETVNYGNGKGFGVIAGDRFEFDYVPSAYIQHNTPASKDGFGDTSTVFKYRIASGNAEHGNFDVAAILSHSFATGTHKNGVATGTYCPTIDGGHAFRRFVALYSLGGVMPTGKIAAQGRSIAW
jgi:hypothetical protein